jgi:cytochrome b6-f complex iron-sulfur subunit
VGEVDTRWKDAFGVWIVRNAEGFYALIAVCTHLGCSPNWLAAENKFKCPCHGSGFYMSGVNFEGPAPRPLERASIVLADDGQILVDKSVKFQQEKGEWDLPGAFLKV